MWPKEFATAPLPTRRRRSPSAERPRSSAGSVPLLEVERVTKEFGGVRAVNDVSFTLEEGELLGIMGPNGSGKTTLFNLIAGALRPDAGRIRLEGHDIAGEPPHRVCARGVARTFQLVRPFGGLSALENVLVGRLYGRARPRPRGTRRGRAPARAGGARGPGAGTRRRPDPHRPQATRAGARPRHAPRLLLLDEFMAGLNPAETATAMALVRRLLADGLTVLMVEHIVWALLDLSAASSCSARARRSPTERRPSWPPIPP